MLYAFYHVALYGVKLRFTDDFTKWRLIIDLLFRRPIKQKPRLHHQHLYLGEEVPGPQHCRYTKFSVGLCCILLLLPAHVAARHTVLGCGTQTKAEKDV